MLKDNKILLHFKDYFSKSSLHGLRFIAEDGRHWTERLFWIIVCLASWCGSCFLIYASWEAFQSNAISFMVETTYLNSNTSFPSISVCENDNLPRIYYWAEHYFGKEHDFNLDEVLKEISYFRGSAYYVKEYCFNGDIVCPDNDYKGIADKVRSSCEEIFIECSWKGKLFNCCKHFHAISTEIGICFTLSSKFEKPENENYINLFSNMNVGTASLNLILNTSTKLYMHPEADIPFYNTLTTDILEGQLRLKKIYSISVRDIENEPEVKQLSINQRKCRFEDENYLTVSNQYSYSTCVIECRKNYQLEHCNCTSHFMPNSDRSQRCAMHGLNCLNKHHNVLSVLKTTWSTKDGLLCDCLPGCREPEYDVITSKEIGIEDNVSVVEIYLDRLPSERYKRNVVRGRLDLVVSMGGAAGLFVGASLLSFVELLFYISLRLCKRRRIVKKK